MPCTQGITTRYLGPTNSKGSRIKATAREASSWSPEMGKTIPLDHSLSIQARHSKAAEALAKELGWTGLWVAGGKPEEDGYMFVNIGHGPNKTFRMCALNGDYGRAGEDWFWVDCQVEGCLAHSASAEPEHG